MEGNERGSERGRSMGGDSPTGAWEGQEYGTVQESGRVQEPGRGKSLGWGRVQVLGKGQLGKGLAGGGARKGAGA